MTTMYRMKSGCRWEAPITLPTCMYRLDNVQKVWAGEGAGAGADKEQPELKPDRVLLQARRLLETPADDLKMLETKQLALLQQLEGLHKKLVSMKSLFKVSTTEMVVSSPDTAVESAANDLPRDIVVNAHPEYAPYSLLSIKKLLNMKIQCYTHSSVFRLPPSAEEFAAQASDSNPAKPDIIISLIWKKGGNCIELNVSSIPVMICGEVNLLRYLISAVQSKLSYGDSSSSWELDSILDICHRLQMHKLVKDRQALIRSLNVKLGNQQWIGGTYKISIADIAAWSIIKQLKTQSDLTNTMKNWMSRCEQSVLH